MRTYLIGLLLFNVCVSGQRFLPDAGDFLEVQYRARNSGPDITEVEIHVDLEKMVEGAVDIDDLTLQVLEEGGCWKDSGRKHVKRGRRYRWRIPILPCISHAFRVILHPSNSSCIEYLEHPKHLGGSPMWMIEQGHRFSPSKPKGLRFGADSTIHWEPVPCVSHYKVKYNTGSEDMIILEDSTFSKLNLSEKCQEVTTSVMAVVGKQASPEAELKFNTCPDEDITLGIESFLLSEDEAEADAKRCPVDPPSCWAEAEAVKHDNLPSTGGPYTEEVPDSFSSSASIIGGSVVLALVILCLIVGVIVGIRRNRSRDSLQIEKL